MDSEFRVGTDLVLSPGTTAQALFYPNCQTHEIGFIGSKIYFFPNLRP